MQSDQPSDVPDSPATQDGCDFHIVGVGASAGGLEALESFFREMPTDTGAAFVVVQHLSPDFKSHMQQLLARQTAIPALCVEDQMKVKPNCIYLIPPKKVMIISGGRLLLTDKDTNSLAHPIDQFFRSLANDCGKFAIGVVLSGTGSDGSRGIRDIHESGGLVIAQSEDSAKFDGMPLNAQETGVVDVVLPPSAMAAAITRYTRGSLSPDQLAEQELPQEALEGVQRVFQLLRAEFNLDFSHYKPSTVARRVNRRVDLNGFSDLASYVNRLQEDRAELNELYKDLLIGVTRFFRDTEAFTRLEEQVIPEIIERSDPSEQIRVWVAGCATGEEAYSIAMLFHEQLTRAGRPLNFKMFATDVHRTSIHTAAQGVYSENALSEVSAERKTRYFRSQRENFVVVPELRQMIVFAPHNVISDAPFTQLDMVTCRNLLIYLQPTAQKKALSLFHFALKTGSTLLLGPSETPGEISDEFDVVDKRWRIYRKRRDVRLPPEMRLPLGVAHMPRAAAALTRQVRSPNFDNQLLATYDRLLEQHMPPSFLVDEGFYLVHTFGGAERFLKPRGGRTSTSLIDLIHSDLKTSLSGALQHAVKEHSTVRYTGIHLHFDDDTTELVNLIVQPMQDSATKVLNLIVKLESLTPSLVELPEVVNDMSVDELTQEHIQSLEVDLRFTRENLQATIEELETANEELQATNEELVASNEELQSTNEELHSVNEELYTVNTEHQQKIEQITEATDDMNNLLATTRVGVIFLDRELCIRRFTPEIARIFDLLPHDIGRRFTSFLHHLQPENIIRQIEEVRDDVVELELEILDKSGNPYFMRVLPYQTGTGVEGVVIALLDISSLQKARTDAARFASVVENTSDFVGTADKNLNIMSLNPAALKMLGLEADCDVGKLAVPEIHPAESWARIRTEAIPHAAENGVWTGETEILPVDGEPVPVSQAIIVHKDCEGETTQFSTIARDIRKQKKAEMQLREAEKKARAASIAKTAFLANVSHELRTPLSAILGFADILTRKLVDEEDLDAARTIRRNGDYLLELVNDILDLSKIEADRLEIRAAEYDLLEIIEDVADLMEFRAQENGMPLHVRFDSPVPKTIRTDRTRLRQILVNLLGNAIKFTEEGSVELVISCEPGCDSDDKNGTLKFQVVDTGIGMSSQTQAKLFEPFSQADFDVTQRFGGTGLGLSISKRLADRLGGTLSVSSELGKGSTFSLQLKLDGPCDEQNLVDAAATPASDDHLQQPNPQLDCHILIADDRRDVWRVCKYFLEEAGATVDIAEDGQQALELVTKAKQLNRPYDLVLMDMQMPIITGYEATRELRQQGFDAPIIALTAGAMKRDREKCMDAGCTDYFAKPVDGRKLLKVVASYTNGQVPTPKKQLKVMLVEDSEDVCSMMKMLLAQQGYEIETATTGADATQLANDFHADVYLLDISLPDMDGFQLIEQLREMPHNVSARFFAVTGQAIDRDRVNRHGFERHFIKPINPKDLQRTIASKKSNRSRASD